MWVCFGFVCLGGGVVLCFVWVLVCCFFSRISFWVLFLTAMELKKIKKNSSVLGIQ